LLYKLLLLSLSYLNFVIFWFSEISTNFILPLSSFYDTGMQITWWQI
jgi:hypothetical protein